MGVHFDCKLENIALKPLCWSHVSILNVNRAAQKLSLLTFFVSLVNLRECKFMFPSHVITNRTSSVVLINHRGQGTFRPNDLTRAISIPFKLSRLPTVEYK